MVGDVMEDKTELGIVLLQEPVLDSGFELELG